MNNQSITMLKEGTVISDEKGEVVDLGAFSKIHFQVRVKVAANASQTLQIQHAAVNEDAAFLDIGTALDIATAGTDEVQMDNFLRYVRYLASGSISTQPTLSLYVIAKEN